MQMEEADGIGAAKQDGQHGHGAELTVRDKQLIGYLATARYLSTEQLQALGFPARAKELCRKRLLRLAGRWGSSRPGRRARKQLHREQRGSGFSHPELALRSVCD